METFLHHKLYISLITSLSAEEALKLQRQTTPDSIRRFNIRDIEQVINRKLRCSDHDPNWLYQRALAIEEQITEHSITVLHISDEDYPSSLKSIYDPPYLLYLRGSIPSKVGGVSIIGTRRATTEGLHQAFKMGASIGLLGIPHYSGLAYGIDSASHEGAVSVSGSTWGIIGSGLLKIYPRSHISLSQRMIDTGGGIISEFPPDMSPAKWTFPKRNRLISGMCSVLYVIEAPKVSGTMITVDYALDHGREVCIDANSLITERSTGTWELADQGAVVIENFEDLLRALNSDDTIRYTIAKRTDRKGNPERIIRYGSKKYAVWREDAT